MVTIWYSGGGFGTREFSLRTFMYAKMPENGKGKAIAQYFGNADTVDAVVAGRVVKDVVLNSAILCNIMPFHIMELLNLKPTIFTARLMVPSTGIDLGSADPAGLIENVPVDIGPVRVLSTFQILRMHNKNSCPLLLGAPYMMAVENFRVQAAATLSIEGLVVKNGKVIRLPFSQQRRREKRRVGRFQPIEIRVTVSDQGAGLPQPSADLSIVSNSSDQCRGSQEYPIAIPETDDLEGDDLKLLPAGRGFALNSPEQRRGSQYNPIQIPDTVYIEGDDLPQPSADSCIVSDSLDQSADQSTMQMLGKAHKLQAPPLVGDSVRQSPAMKRLEYPHHSDADMAPKHKRVKLSALDESHGTIGKQIDDAGPSRVVENAVKDICIDAVVTRTLNWAQNT